MNSPISSLPPRKPFLSAEALIGIGMTFGMIGLLVILLGWAEHLREVKEDSFILLAVGALLLVIGVIAAISGGVTKHRAEDFRPPPER